MQLICTNVTLSPHVPQIEHCSGICEWGRDSKDELNWYYTSPLKTSVSNTLAGSVALTGRCLEARESFPPWHKCTMHSPAKFQLGALKWNWEFGHNIHIPDICHFLYANAISRSGKGTPKKCVNSRHCLMTKSVKQYYGIKFIYLFQ